MTRGAAKERPEHLLGVVIDLLITKGYDGWQLREVADNARVSLSTIYAFYPSRDELIVSALETWMSQHIYRPLPLPEPGTPPKEAMIAMVRALFEPWEEHPEMLEVFVRAAQTNTSSRLHAQGMIAAAPLVDLIEGLERSFAADLVLIWPTVAYGALIRYVHGDIKVTEIFRIIERTLRRLDWPDSPKRGLRPRSPRRVSS